MSFLSRLFGQGESLAIIFVKIAKELAVVRETWFEGCVAAFEEARTANPPIDTRVANRTFGRDVDLMIKAYQLAFTIPFLMAAYFPRVKRRVGNPPPGQSGEEGFIDAFYATVAGADLSETAAYTRRYDEASRKEGQKGTGLITFSSDIARYIAGDDPLASEGMLLWPHVGILIAMTKIIVANAFGDRATVKRLGAGLRDFVRVEEQQDR